MFFLKDENAKSRTDAAIELFKKTNRLHRACFDRVAPEKFGIHRGQHMMLMFIFNNPGITQKQIAEYLEISPAAVANAIKRLENEGFVVRCTDSSDTRCNNITITEKGITVVNTTKILFQDIDSIMFEGFTEDDMSVFCDCLEKMACNLRKLQRKEGVK